MKTTDKAQELLDRLHTGIENLVTGDDWKVALEWQSRFHKYSFGNTLLIHFQCPNATYVGGLKSVWNKMGRYVRKGEHGIAILAPFGIDKTDPETGEVKEVVIGYRTAYVFDVSQTEGAPFEPPTILNPDELDGDAPADLFAALSRQVEARGFVVEPADEDRLHNAKGLTIPSTWNSPQHDTLASRGCKGLVLVKRAASPLQRTKTLVHELAHVMLHVDNGYDYAGCRGVAETEAESVAFIVCGALGLPTDSYSFAYVGSWADGDLDLIRKTGERVAKTARVILDGLGERA